MRCGVIPEQNDAALRTAGIAKIFGPGLERAGAGGGGKKEPVARFSPPYVGKTRDEEIDIGDMMKSMPRSIT